MKYFMLIIFLVMLIACNPNQITDGNTQILEKNEEIIEAVETIIPTPASSKTASIQGNDPTDPTHSTPFDLQSTETLNHISSVTPNSAPTRTGSQKITKLSPNGWKRLPVIPYVNDSVFLIYQRGLELGNNPNAYSKLGDCGTTPTWFMGDFDRGHAHYNLGDFQELETVIKEFNGSHSRTSLAARSGFNAPSMFAPLWSDLDYCAPNEAPLECEYRVHRPIIAFIMLGSNDVWHPDEFEPSMRKIIEYSIENGVIPILSTKADNLEGDGSINDTIAHLALEYEVPLINFWRAVQDLPGKGLQEDGVHLTWEPNFFDDPENLTRAWPIRNLTALQALDVVMKKIEKMIK